MDIQCFEKIHNIWAKASNTISLKSFEFTPDGVLRFRIGTQEREILGIEKEADAVKTMTKISVKLGDLTQEVTFGSNDGEPIPERPPLNQEHYP